MEVNNGFALNVKSLYNSNFVKGVRDLLNMLTVETLYSLAQTACNQKINPENKEEAIEVILLYTPDIDRFFAYRRITMDILTRYLHLNAETIAKLATHHHLMAHVKKLWVAKYSFEDERGEEKKKENVYLLSNQKESIAQTDNNAHINRRHTVRSDKFAHDFAEWFYSCVNNTVDSSPSQKNGLHSTMFCLNASSDVYIVSSDSLDVVHSAGAENCVRAFRDVVCSCGFMFMPNLETGTQAVASSHGLIKVLCCGTLHVDKNFVGIFEQEFGLVQSPIDKNWKIFYSKANFRKSIYELPKLLPSAVFEIETF